ncbi:hypothetical protein [Sulfurimonas sp. CS5]|jgi:hypothetical protein
MKKIILLIALTLGALQAASVVHYDTTNDDNSGISKPNHPNSDIYPGK